VEYALASLDRAAVVAYVTHRLTIAGAHASVCFTSRALARVYRRSHGVPRTINLLCDGALSVACSRQARRITPDMVEKAAARIDPVVPRTTWLARHGSFAAAAAVALAACLGAVGFGAWFYEGVAENTLHASARTGTADVQLPARSARRLPDDALMTIVAGSFPIERTDAIATLTARLESAGYAVYYSDVDLGGGESWKRVLAGAYANAAEAAAAASALARLVPGLQPTPLPAAHAGRPDR
jgi:hypothetical protein